MYVYTDGYTHILYKKKKVKIVNVISESEFSEYWSCSKDSKMSSKHDKMWLFKSTFLKHHETYLTLTVGKNNSEGIGRLFHRTIRTVISFKGYKTVTVI